jgi:hypothetical protein
LDESEAPAFVAARGLDELPRPSPRIRLAVSWTLPCGMRNTRERDTSGLDTTFVGTGAWLQSGKRFTSALGPQVEGYRSDYYQSTAQGADAAVSLQVLREDHQLQELVPAKALAAAPVKDAKLDEALAKECQATLLNAEHTLVALARTLPWEAMTEAQESLFLSLQWSLAHSAALAAKSAGKSASEERPIFLGISLLDTILNHVC